MNLTKLKVMLSSNQNQLNLKQKMDANLNV